MSTVTEQAINRIQEVSKKKKTAFKKQIKDQIRANFVDYVLQNKTTKLRTVLKNHL